MQFISDDDNSSVSHSRQELQVPMVQLYYIHVLLTHSSLMSSILCSHLTIALKSDEEFEDQLFTASPRSEILRGVISRLRAENKKLTNINLRRARDEAKKDSVIKVLQNKVLHLELECRKMRLEKDYTVTRRNPNPFTSHYLLPFVVGLLAASVIQMVGRVAF